jgi:ArsR family transcriptional regulator, arsenate/arsenite/antimonite-responsive transcriptional repressor
MLNTTLKPERIFRALSDKTRLRILHLLLGGELCVCDIVSVLGCPQPTASRHLAYLRKVSLVTVRKEGVWCYYQFAAANTDFESSLRKCIKACGELPRLAKDLEKIERTRRICCE